MNSIPHVFDWLAQHIPRLEQSLKASRQSISPGDYTKKTFIVSLYASLSVALVLLIFSLISDSSILPSIVALVFFFPFIFFFLINKPRYDFINSEKYVEAEIVSAIRFLILELKTEKSVYEALIHTSQNFATIGIYFDEIISKVKLGKTLQQSLTEAVELCPSAHLRNLFWQLLNSLQTGADISQSLQTQLDDVIESQKIKVEEYGRELNAFSLFYMMIAIIIPTIGFTIVSAVLTFVGVALSLGVLFFIWIFLSIIQYFFLKIIASRRPAVEAY